MTKYILTLLLSISTLLFAKAQEEFDYNQILAFMSDVGVPDFKSYYTNEETDFFEMPNGEYFLQVSSTKDSSGVLKKNIIRFYSHDDKIVTYFVAYDDYKIKLIKKTLSTKSTTSANLAWRYTPEESISYSAKKESEEIKDFLYYFYWAHSFQDKYSNMSNKN